jgi:hypothetical protein
MGSSAFHPTAAVNVRPHFASTADSAKPSDFFRLATGTACYTIRVSSWILPLCSVCADVSLPLPEAVKPAASNLCLKERE